MPVYWNIEVNNGILKCPILRRIFLNSTWDAVVVLGAQVHSDIKMLCELGKTNNIPVILLDIRQDELDQHDNSAEKRLTDLSSIPFTKEYIKQLQTRFNNPFIYDNLCGGKRRNEHLHLFLNAFPSVISYISDRNNRIKEIEPYIISKTHYSRKNYVVHLSKH